VLTRRIRCPRAASPVAARRRAQHPSIRAYRKCGFVIEGTEREAAFVDGAWNDDVMMGILAGAHAATNGAAAPS
jgi:L-amino acid N-acyltransferase YncA